MTKHILLILFTVILQNTFAQKSVEREKHKTKKENINIAFVPFFNKEIDDQFTYFLNQGRFKVTNTTKISQNLQNEFLKNSWFKSFVDNFEQNLKTKKNFFESANKNGITEFKINTLNSDVIYLHSSIKSKTVTKINKSGNVTLYCTTAVYDLQTGELIMECKVKSKSKFNNNLPEKNETIKTLTQDLFACFEQKFK